MSADIPSKGGTEIQTDKQTDTHFISMYISVLCECVRMKYKHLDWKAKVLKCWTGREEFPMKVSQYKQGLEVLEGNPRISKSSRCWGAFYFFYFKFLVLMVYFQCFKFQSHSFKIFKFTQFKLFNPIRNKRGAFFQTFY